ncbi:YopX family protein [Bacillus cereus]|uniref:YopX family protein n=1 Tax=Bacillus cereus TaxID=1396 RepID=UPI001D14321A|nr:YopX family protein [Bacillus cereus]MCC3686876.1 YopX family protein [Bacillus cereus]
MNENRYRVWDIRRKWMLYNTESCGYVDYEMHPIAVINKILSGEDKNLKFMQVTGFKDKNEKEIFESDSDGHYIVKKGEFPVRDSETGKVIEVVHGWYLDPIHKSIESGRWELPLNDYWVNKLGNGFDKNIYENPELLNDSNMGNEVSL